MPAWPQAPASLMLVATVIKSPVSNVEKKPSPSAAVEPSTTVTSRHALIQRKPYQLRMTLMFR